MASSLLWNIKHMLESYSVITSLKHLGNFDSEFNNFYTNYNEFLHCILNTNSHTLRIIRHKTPLDHRVMFYLELQPKEQ